MIDDIETAARAAGLTVNGGFHPERAAPASAPDGASDPLGHARTVLLLGPDEPDFWPLFRASPEAADGAPEPMDRWSARVVGALAEKLGAAPLFPFGGPPRAPFLAFALRSGRCWSSPVGMLVHDRAGLLVSFRGALAFSQRIALPPPPAASPCEACETRPCLSACPIGALTGAGYDVPACRDHLSRPEGAPCREAGCLVRRACPVSARFPRPAEQSAFHMASFREGLKDW